MKFKEFKDILIEKNILLFDYDYRISFKNIFLLNDEIFESTNQTGGSNSNYYISPFIILKRNDNKVIEKIITKLVVSNISAAKYLCKIKN